MLKDVQAFPQSIAVTPTGAQVFGAQGMTLRDYFAAQAMKGLLSHPKCADVQDEGIPEAVASEAYMIANAMLAERSK